MKHKTVFSLIGLLVLGVAAFFYIDNIFLPIQFKHFITTKGEKLLKRRVSVDTIDFRLVQGFSIKNVSISQKDDPDRPFLQIDEITFNLLFAPIFRKKALVIPNIKIKYPYVYIYRDKNNAWNFSDLLDVTKSMKNKNSFSVLLRKLSLEGGTIHYKDTSRSQDFFESFKNINLHTTLSLNKGIRFVFQAEVPKQKTLLKIKGNYGLLPKKLTAQILGDNIHLARYLPLLQTSQPYIDLTDGILSSGDFGIIYEKDKLQTKGSFLINKTGLHVGENNEIRGTVYVPSMLLTWQDNKWNAKGQLQLPSVHMTSSDGKEFQGDLKADLNLLTVFGNNIASQGDVTLNNARLTLDENKYFKGNITAANASLIKGDGKVRLQGNFDVKKADMTIGALMSLQGDISTVDTNLTWSRNEKGPDNFNVKSGFSMNSAHAALGENKTITSNINVHKASLSSDGTKTTVEALGQLDTADIVFAGNKRFKGSPFFNIFFEHTPKSRTPIDYQATLRFTNSTFTGIPYLDTIDNLEGVTAIMPDHIQTDRLKFKTQETNIELSGLVTNFAKPALNIKASSESVDLQKVLTLFPVLKEKLHADLAGQAAADASYNGLLYSPSDAIIEASAQLSDTTLTHEKLPEAFTDISGYLDYTNDLLKWRGLNAYYKETPYLFNGQLNNFSRPTIDTKVSADQLELTAQVKILHSAFQVISFVGDYLNSSFDLKGDVHLFEDAPADIDIRGKFILDLKDAGILIPQIKHRVEQFKPVGILSGEGIYKGRLDNWRNWQLALDMNSDKITIKEYPFEGISIRFSQRDRAITKCNVASKIYNGNLTVTSSADLREEDAPFTATIDLKNMDFAKFREDRKPKNRQLAGTLSLQADLEGSTAQWRELTGEGALTITDGHLWQWNILDGISKALLIPEFKNFVFTAAHGDFEIRDQRIWTQNAQMTSKSVTLDGKGWIDFHKNLNFDIAPTFSKVAILQSESLKKGITSILTQTDGYLNIKLTGTLEKPRHHVEKSPLKIIEGTIGNTTDTIKGVIEGVIEGVF